MNGISRTDTNIYKQTESSVKNNDTKKKVADNSDNSDATGKTDGFVKSPSAESLTYSPAKVTKATDSQSSVTTKNRSQSDLEILNNAIAESEKTVSNFKEMIRQVIQGQANSNTDKTQGTNGINLTSIGVPQAAADEIQRLSQTYGPVELTGKVGEGDYWGVDATAQRIFDFAINLSGGDKEKLATLKDAISQAFGDSEKLFGGTLPGISYQTLDKINSLFEDYENGNGLQE